MVLQLARTTARTGVGMPSHIWVAPLWGSLGEGSGGMVDKAVCETCFEGCGL